MERRPRLTRALLVSIFVLLFTIFVCSTSKSHMPVITMAKYTSRCQDRSIYLYA